MRDHTMDILENEIQNILVEWDPLGDDKWKIEDLDNYEIEAIDISSSLYIENIRSEKACIGLVRDIITHAFNIEVSPEELGKYGQRIWQIYLKMKGLKNK